MTEQQLSLLPFYAGWRIYNQRLVAAIAPLTAEQLALRTTPHHWSIGMYATHYRRQSCLVVPRTDGRGGRRSHSPRIMGAGRL